MNLVYLYDRGNPNDQIASGQLRFDSGSVVAFGPVNNDGISSHTRSKQYLLNSWDD